MPVLDALRHSCSFGMVKLAQGILHLEFADLRYLFKKCTAVYKEEEQQNSSIVSYDWSEILNYTYTHTTCFHLKRKKKKLML